MTYKRSMELLNAVIDHIYVAEKSQETIRKLFEIGFTAEELVDEFNWSLTDVREVEYDLLLDELATLVDISENDNLTEEENSRYIEIVDVLHENNVEIPFGIEI